LQIQKQSQTYVYLSEISMPKIGLLPASGSASRLNGIPKFMLPIPGGTLLSRHIDQMLQVCDEVRISTRKAWIPLLNQLDLPSGVKIYEIEPSTFSNAIQQMADKGRLLIGMPDTYISSTNHYESMIKSDGDVVLAGFNCPQYLHGAVGQFEADEYGNVFDLKDKEEGCTYSRMWGAMLLNTVQIDGSLDNPSHQIMNWIREGKSVKAVNCNGSYVDAGTFEGLKALYASDNWI
jgi:hypothetical protein